MAAARRKAKAPEEKTAVLAPLAAHRLRQLEADLKSAIDRRQMAVTLILEQVAGLGEGEEVHYKGIRETEDGTFEIVYLRG